ncbi:MAG: hypothetical protein KGL39_11195 [Patescibacteria group bacterium]|nr:hypothetical protein [Patescibacteria group bacterium]
MRHIIIALSLLALSACASLSDTGITQFTAKPFVDPVSKSTLCCEVSYIGGKEIASAHALMIKKGNDYSISIDEQGVKAFQGAAIAANATQTTFADAAKVGTAIALAPMAPAALAGAGALAATGGVGAAIVGGAAVLGAQKLMASPTPAKP